MKTIYLRNVPDDVADALMRRAADEGISVNAFAVRELSSLVRRPDNASLFADLPDLPISTAQILAALDADRRK